MFVSLFTDSFVAAVAEHNLMKKKLEASSVEISELLREVKRLESDQVREERERERQGIDERESTARI